MKYLSSLNVTYGVIRNDFDEFSPKILLRPIISRIRLSSKAINNEKLRNIGEFRFFKKTKDNKLFIRVEQRLSVKFLKSINFIGSDDIVYRIVLE